MNNPEHVRRVEEWYQSLATVNLDLFMEVHTPDCIYNISGHSPISGKVDFAKLAKDVLPQVFPRLQMDRYQFAKKWKVVCQDERRIVGMMEADGPGTNGKRYDQRYIHIFEFRDGHIAGVWEFFDTALADQVLFYDPENSATAGRLAPFEFPA